MCVREQVCVPLYDRSENKEKLYATFQYRPYSKQSYCMIELLHTDARHFVIIECCHLARDCSLKCGCSGLMLFRTISCLGTIICYINTIGIVPVYSCKVCDALVASCATADYNVHETKWTPHVKRGNCLIC